MLNDFGFNNVPQFAIHKVAECVGIECPEFFPGNELLEKIQIIDNEIYKVLDDFIKKYSDWYSSSLVKDKHNEVNARKHLQLMNERDETRNLLITEIKKRNLQQ